VHRRRQPRYGCSGEHAHSKSVEEAEKIIRAHFPVRSDDAGAVGTRVAAADEPRTAHQCEPRRRFFTSRIEFAYPYGAGVLDDVTLR